MRAWSDGYEVRYPSGDFEVIATNGPIPAIGETIRRNGKIWKVIDKLRNGRLVLRVALVPETNTSERSLPR